MTAPNNKSGAIAYVFALVMVLVPLRAGVPYARFLLANVGLVVLGAACMLVILHWLFRRVEIMAQRGAHTVTPGRDLPAVVIGLCVVVGLVVAQVVLAEYAYPRLSSSTTFRGLVGEAPSWARYVVELLRWGLRAAVPLVLLWGAGFLHYNGAFGWLKATAAATAMPEFPADPPVTCLGLGELHAPDGSRVTDPGWHFVPAQGLYTGTLIIGAPGTGKTEGAIYPYLRQLVNLHRSDPARRLGGFVADVKGDLLPRLRAMCVQAGREEDLLVIPDVRANALNQPHLSAPSLAKYLRQAQEAAQGKGHSDPIWANSAEELAMQVVRGVRLAWRREPTIADIVRYGRSDVAFGQTIAAAKQRETPFTEDETEDLATLERWYEESFQVMDPKTRASVAMNLNSFLSFFETPAMRRFFSPTAEEERFPGFGQVLDQGRIVVLSMPDAEAECQVVGTLLKLAFQKAVLRRLHGDHKGAFRETFFVADEYARLVTDSDSDFFALCRAAKCINIVATQALSSLHVALRDPKRVEHLLSQFGNMVILRPNDEETARWAANLCGKEERYIASRTVSENAQGTRFSFLDRQKVRGGDASSTESVTWTLQDKYRFRPEDFRELASYQAIVVTTNGVDKYLPTVLYLIRDFGDWNESWFEWRAAMQSKSPVALTRRSA